MAVDVKTLTIGSHILVNGKRERVGGIRPVRSPFNVFQVIIQHEAKIFSSLGYVPSTSNTIEPIPITPELLKELGFKSKREGCWEHWWKDCFDLQHRDESVYWHFHGDIGIEYLHELEDLYNLVYGVELIKE